MHLSVLWKAATLRKCQVVFSWLLERSLIPALFLLPQSKERNAFKWCEEYNHPCESLEYSYPMGMRGRNISELVLYIFKNSSQGPMSPVTAAIYFRVWGRKSLDEKQTKQLLQGWRRPAWDVCIFLLWLQRKCLHSESTSKWVHLSAPWKIPLR